MIPTYNGQTIPIITVPPDWSSQDLVLSTEHDTIVREALDNSEERMQMRPRCLYGLTYTATGLSSQETSYLRKLFERSQALPVGCPIWTDAVTLEASASIGATSLTTSSTIGLLFPVFAYVLVWQDFKTWEVLEVDDASVDGTISLAEASTIQWAANTTLVVPLAFGHVSRPTDAWHTTDHASVQVAFQERLLFGEIEEESPWPIAPVALSVSQPSCNHEVTLDWDSIPGVQWVLEYSTDGLAWAELMNPIPGDPDTVTISNDFDTGLYWRVRAKHGSTLSAPSNTVQSIVATVGRCSVSVTGTSASPRLLSTPWFNSVVNSGVHGTSDFIHAVERRIYYYDQSSPTASTITVTCPTAGATILYTTDGALPTLAGPNTHDTLLNTSFGCIIKARAYKDGCYGPLMCILLDKAVKILNGLAIDGSSKSSSTQCRKPQYFRYPQLGPGGIVTCVEGTIVSGDSCSVTWDPLPPEGGTLLEKLKWWMCNNLSTGATSVYLFDSTESSSEDPDIPDPEGCPPAYDDWGGEYKYAAATVFICTALTWNRHAPTYDAYPSGLNQSLHYAGGDVDEAYVAVASAMGPGGNATSVNTALAAMVALEVPTCAQWKATPGAQRVNMPTTVDVVLSRETV